MATGTDNLTGAAPGPRRVACGLVAVVVLLLVVGAGTGAARSERHAGGASGRWDISDPGWLLDAAASVLVVATVAVAAVLVYAFWPAGRRRPREPDAPEIFHEPPSARWWQKAAAIAPALALIGGLVWALLATRSSGGPAAPSPPPGLALPSGSQAPRTGTSAPMIHWWVVAAVVGAVVATASLLLGLWRRRRRVSADRTQAARRAEAVGALDDCLDAVEAEPDSRRAVIAAYGRMEEWLARAGVPRAAWEAPFEYLDRVLIELGAPAAIAATLTELFERAKFAPHPVAGSMKRRAIDVLVELRAELGRAA